ncbi:ATP-binding protein [Novosphingobium sp. G106]|uniref:ATP-binding protein n=1 Tax=Novosphingobium sp. G106 TaxID=2849500 RepID=UPI001C2D3F2C|nr:ATP-binding protein [Novosphingobium sp. G106]MBV1691978.1 ATP-binding protein [Novosphingobium sp. G106]
MAETRSRNPAEPSADAGLRNMHLLMQLRWIAVSGQLITIAVVDRVMGIKLPLAPLLIAPALLAAINLISVPYLRRRDSVRNVELTGALLVDVVALAWQLYHSGGLANPFTSLFLLQVVIGAILLEGRSSWGIVIATLVALGALALKPVPLVLPPGSAFDPMALYLAGSLVCFVLIAVLLVAFVTRINRNFREADAALAAVRQRAAEEDHIVRMGLLASGAAHELGTPLSSMSVILGDLARHPAITENSEVLTDIADMEAELRRCKVIVGGILTSAGEVRSENPSITTLKTFLADAIEDWRGRTAGAIYLDDEMDDDMTIVADPALRQVIGNIVENAVDAAAKSIVIHARRTETMLELEVRDDGPGFSTEMLADFGRPYASTKPAPGSGLGLFLVVNVLRKLGGNVDVANQDGEGARVRLTVPLSTLLYEREVPR